MAYFAGLDVSIDETAVCVVDGDGAVHLETSVPTDPGHLAKALKPYKRSLKRVGHEAGALAPWLHPALLALGVPAVCVEARHARAAMAAQRNKTDRADALGLAHLIRTGWYKTAHMKAESTYRLRLVLTHRRNLKRKFLDIENAIRHSLKSFGIRIKKTGRVGFEAKVREATRDDPLTAELIDVMLAARAALWKQYCHLHSLVVKVTRSHEVCRQFMEIPGIGPVTALSFLTGVDDPARFKRSRDVGAYFGLTTRRVQSGSSIDFKGRISKAGDGDVRRALYGAASAMLTRFKGKSALKSWGLSIEKRRGHKKALVAVARKLAVILHAMWRDGTFYDDPFFEGKAKATNMEP